jgi:tRNA threonylcarbamoyladenosine biosynthesis protein TsaE
VKKLTFTSPEETMSFAASYAKEAPNGQIIALIGNLGAGKTTFSQGFALGLGVEESVISPTFKLVSEYHGKRILNHIDCYRLDSSNDFLNIGGENFLSCENGITIIEWADRIKDIWLNDWVIIYFERDQKDENTRHVKITGND